MAVKSVIEAVREAIREEMARDPKVFVIGEDVGIRGGVFLATARNGFVGVIRSGWISALDNRRTRTYVLFLFFTKISLFDNGE